MKLVENEFIKFMEKFDENPFRIILEDGEHLIGDGEPAFTVKINKIPKMMDMLKLLQTQGTTIPTTENQKRQKL